MYNICIRRCKYTYMFIYLPNSEHSIKQPGCKGLEQQQKGPKRISGTWTCALWKGNSDTNHMFSHLISNLSRMYVPSDLRSIPSLGPPYQHRILVHFRNFLPERVWVTFHPELHRWMLHAEHTDPFFELLQTWRTDIHPYEHGSPNWRCPSTLCTQVPYPCTYQQLMIYIYIYICKYHDTMPYMPHAYTNLKNCDTVLAMRPSGCGFTFRITQATALTLSGSF